MRRTEKLAISRVVKAQVANRDSWGGWPCCVLCGLPSPADDPLAFSNAHYIPRSHGGLGTEENILTLCPACHRKFDQSGSRDAIRKLLRRYLQEQYETWNEEDLIYRKD